MVMTTRNFAEVFASDELTDDLAELGQLLIGLPPEARSQAASVYERVLKSNRQRKKLLSLVRDSIADMRLDLKYLEFDLEATCRERDRLRRQLNPDDDLEQGFRQEFEGEVDDP